MKTEKKPDYINKKIKKVSQEHLMKVLEELNDKHERQRREDAIAINEALNSGFRCGPKHY